MRKTRTAKRLTYVLVAGLGVTETTLDFEIDPEGQPIVQRIDPLEFGYDTHARKKGLEDARYKFRVIDMPRTEAEERFEGFGRKKSTRTGLLFPRQ